MSSSRGIFKNVIVAIALITYIVISIILISDNRQQLRCQDFKIIVLDSAKASFITPAIVDSMVEQVCGPLKGQPIDSIDIYAIEKNIESNPYVNWSDVYCNSEGLVSVKLTQRVPVMRFVSEAGYDFYVDTSLHILQPSPSYVASVPIISGDVTFSFSDTFYGKLDEKKASKDILYIKKLINFVQFISADDFLRGFVMQVFLSRDAGGAGGERGAGGVSVGGVRDGEGDIECTIVPRIGRQIVVFGDLDNAEQKLMKVKAFYLQYYGLPVLDSARWVDVSYKGQVITR